LNESEEISRRQAVKNNLPLRERTGEQEFQIRGLKDKSTLQESFEERTAQHQ